MRGVEREPARLLAIVELPCRAHAMRGDIDRYHVCVAFVVEEDAAMGIADGELRFAGKTARSRRHGHPSRARSRPGCVPLNVQISLEDSSKTIVSGPCPETAYVPSTVSDAMSNLRHAVAAAVARPGLARLLVHRHAMHAFGAGHGAHDAAVVRVHDHDAVGTRHEQPVRRRVDRKVVPAAGSADIPALHRRGRVRCRRERSRREQDRREEPMHVFMRAIPCSAAAPLLNRDMSWPARSSCRSSGRARCPCPASSRRRELRAERLCFGDRVLLVHRLHAA